VFLFNPNYRELNAEFKLDASIGLSSGDSFVFREMYPRPGVLSGNPTGGAWKRGDSVKIPVKGPDARVFEIVPAEKIPRPALLGAAGKVVLNGGELTLSDVSGPVGHALDLTVLLPTGATVTKASVNGATLPFQNRNGTVVIPVSFAGTRFDHCPQIGTITPNFAGTDYRAELRIPGHVSAQLEARRKSWPVPYTEEELLATWRGSDRLLMFIHIADPNDEWKLGLQIDGQPAVVQKAYSDVFPLGRERTFTGFYVDVSNLNDNAPHQLEVTLPAGLMPGQFQGLFLENIETAFTSELTR
jgi:hypothetical protein